MKEIEKNLTAIAHTRAGRSTHNETEEELSEALDISTEVMLDEELSMLDQDTTTAQPEEEGEEEELIIPVRSVEMMTETVLSYVPLRGVKVDSHSHHGEFKRTVFSSGQTGGKVGVEDSWPHMSCSRQGPGLRRPEGPGTALSVELGGLRLHCPGVSPEPPSWPRSDRPRRQLRHRRHRATRQV